jgi:hypothetical protein
MGDEVSGRTKKALLAGNESVKGILDQSIEQEVGRKLSVESIERYRKIAIGINEVIKIMNQIDEAIESHGARLIK